MSTVKNGIKFNFGVVNDECKATLASALYDNYGLPMWAIYFKDYYQSASYVFSELDNYFINYNYCLPKDEFIKQMENNMKSILIQNEEYDPQIPISDVIFYKPISDLDAGSYDRDDNIFDEYGHPIICDRANIMSHKIMLVLKNAGIYNRPRFYLPDALDSFCESNFYDKTLSFPTKYRQLPESEIYVIYDEKINAEIAVDVIYEDNIPFVSLEKLITIYADMAKLGITPSILFSTKFTIHKSVCLIIGQIFTMPLPPDYYKLKNIDQIFNSLKKKVKLMHDHNILHMNLSRASVVLDKHNEPYIIDFRNSNFTYASEYNPDVLKYIRDMFAYEGTVSDFIKDEANLEFIAPLHNPLYFDK